MRLPETMRAQWGFQQEGPRASSAGSRESQASRLGDMSSNPAPIYAITR